MLLKTNDLKWIKTKFMLKILRKKIIVLFNSHFLNQTTHWAERSGPESLTCTVKGRNSSS